MNASTAFVVGYIALLLYFFLFPFRLSDYDDLNRARWRRCLLVTGAVLALALSIASLSELMSARAYRQTAGSAQVWVRSRSGFYYCPGTEFYGRLHPGTYMSESNAVQSGYQPSLGQTCR
jgi:hypothetical protein